jgi:type II secretory pathway component PulJ
VKVAPNLHVVGVVFGADGVAMTAASDETPTAFSIREGTKEVAMAATRVAAMALVRRLERSAELEAVVQQMERVIARVRPRTEPSDPDRPAA